MKHTQALQIPTQRGYGMKGMDTDWRERWKQNYANRHNLKWSKKKLKKWKKKQERKNWERWDEIFAEMRANRGE